MMLIEAIKHQFNNAFDILAAVIPSFSTQQWRCRVGNDKTPGQLVLHTLACAEFYTYSDLSVQLRYVQPWTQMPDEELPSQDVLTAYLAEVRSKTTTWIDSVGDQGLPGLAVPYAPDQKVSHLERFLYTLRHLVHHTGELCAYQKQCGLLHTGDRPEVAISRACRRAGRSSRMDGLVVAEGLPDRRSSAIASIGCWPNWQPESRSPAKQSSSSSASASGRPSGN